MRQKWEMQQHILLKQIEERRWPQWRRHLLWGYMTTTATYIVRELEYVQGTLG